ncbi:AraC family transcriptional regulator [Rhizobium sp. BK376]|uniref:AraC family transcriptional regulator n=1 Tax=Rhizobium sp. BK376 TaxID=2512149 RepID=UPI001052CBDC|nr:AraC family transcriptional regulator [Rhizobium sp. BK376]TCR88018.1 AraC family transcriptional activator of mtrCDE [Rhizobium sp. BK376]
MDWLSHLLSAMPVSGRLDLRCLYGAPWRIDQAAAEQGAMAYHAVLSGSAIVEDPFSGIPQRLNAGDILMIPSGIAHSLHDGSGERPVPAVSRPALNLVFSENAGTGERLDMLCGHFVTSPPHNRMLRAYLPSLLIIREPQEFVSGARSTAAAQVRSLIALMRTESGEESLGSRAMLNAFSAALFTLALRLASEAADTPVGLLALAGNPRLASALTAMFENPAHPWTLPNLGRLCHMSRATLARHFQGSLGRSASDLLLDIRMTLAANELRKPGQSTGAIAAMVGYQSEAAFQRAFKQHAGMTASQWRRAMKPRENLSVALRQRSHSRGRLSESASSDETSLGGDQGSSSACADTKFSV